MDAQPVIHGCDVLASMGAAARVGQKWLARADGVRLVEWVHRVANRHSLWGDLSCLLLMSRTGVSYGHGDDGKWSMVMAGLRDVTKGDDGRLAALHVAS